MLENWVGNNSWGNASTDWYSWNKSSWSKWSNDIDERWRGQQTGDTYAVPGEAPASYADASEYALAVDDSVAAPAAENTVTLEQKQPYFFCAACPAAAKCSNKSWKNAKCWAFTRENCIAKVKNHLIDHQSTIFSNQKQTSSSSISIWSCTTLWQRKRGDAAKNEKRFGFTIERFSKCISERINSRRLYQEGICITERDRFCADD